MTIALIQQFEYERKAWNRLLDYLEEENIQYKCRISEMSKNNIDITLLETIEVFLNEFIKEDQIISLCRHDINVLNEVLDKEKDGALDGNTFKAAMHDQDKLRKEIEVIEQQFNFLKFKFNKYLSEVALRY